MIAWYRGYYGSYNKGETMQYIDGTFDRREMFRKAQKVANETEKIVTIEEERRMNLKYYKVIPE